MNGAPMASGYRAKVSQTLAPRVRNSFDTLDGKPVFWSAVCWAALRNGQERATARPLAQEDRAKWAASVLSGHYEEREYVVIRQVAESAVEASVMDAFESEAIADLVRLELAAKYRAATD